MSVRVGEEGSSRLFDEDPRRQVKYLNSDQSFRNDFFYICRQIHFFPSSSGLRAATIIALRTFQLATVVDADLKRKLIKEMKRLWYHC